MFTFVDGWGVSNGSISFVRNETYSFQISVDHVEVMHVLQAFPNAGQLNGSVSNAAAGSSDNVQARGGLHVDPF